MREFLIRKNGTTGIGPFLRMIVSLLVSMSAISFSNYIKLLHLDEIREETRVCEEVYSLYSDEQIRCFDKEDRQVKKFY